MIKQNNDDHCRETMAMFFLSDVEMFDRRIFFFCCTWLFCLPRMNKESYDFRLFS